MSEGAIQQKMVMNRADCRAITHMLDHKLPHYKQKFLCTVTKLEVQKGILDSMNRDVYKRQDPAQSRDPNRAAENSGKHPHLHSNTPDWSESVGFPDGKTRFPFWF